MNENHTIAPLSEVHLMLEAGATRERMDMTPSPIPMDFILGVASEGLAGIESALIGRKASEQVFLEVKKAAITDVFGHLPTPGFIFSAPALTFYVKLDIVAAAPADNRDIIKAMAAATQCGCSCGCDQH
jgi:hypothetical protein